MFVQIEKIIGNETIFKDGYMWDAPSETKTAFADAKRKYAVPFAMASYLVDLYQDENNLIDTFPISEVNYRLLTGHNRKQA